MPRRHQRSGCRNQWSDEQLQAALEAVRSGKMKAHAAALKFCIPSSTLYDHLKGKSQRRYGGHPTILTCAEERLQHLARFCRSLGILYRIRTLLASLYCCVGLYITACGRENPFRDSTPEYDWWCGFLHRWPKLTQRKPEHLPCQRVQCTCPENDICN